MADRLAPHAHPAARNMTLRVRHIDLLRCPVCQDPIRAITVIDEPRVLEKIPLAETENPLSLARGASSTGGRATNQIPISLPRVPAPGGRAREDGAAGVFQRALEYVWILSASVAAGSVGLYFLLKRIPSIVAAAP